MSRNRFLCGVGLACAFLASGQKAPAPMHPFNLVQIGPEVVGTNPLVMQSSIHGVLVLNGTDKTLHLIKDGKLVRSFGELGTGPGQIYTPIVAANSSQIADVEWPSQRVQWFTSDGKYLSTCRIPSSLTTRTAALTDDNLLVLNDSHAAAPILFMNSNCKVIGSVGSRETPSALYNSNNKSKDDLYKDASNRVELAVAGDSIYAAYLIAPVLKKYDRSGKLIFSINLDHAIDDSFWKYSPATGGMSTGVDGTQVPLVTRSISIDPVTGQIWVLAALELKKYAALYNISPDGKRILRYPISSPIPSGELQAMAVYGNAVYCSLIFAHGVYTSPLPTA